MDNELKSFTRNLIMPNRVIRIGEIVTITDTRGHVYKGTFAGYRSGFLALVSCDDFIKKDFDESNMIFINITRIVTIIVNGVCIGNQD